MPGEGEWAAGAVKVRTSTLHRHCEEWLRGRRFHGDMPSADGFGRDLKELCPSGERTNPLHVAGERVRFYRVPALATARAEFERWLDSKVEWSA